MIEIRPDDLSGAAIRALLDEHLADMHAQSPPESVHALPLEALRAPEVSFWTAWDGAALLGCGALKTIDARHAEIKSMRTVAAARGRGVGAAMLAHLVAEAHKRGLERLSLETGAEPGFAAARRLYARFGFVECAPFADYRPDPNSVFMTLDLRPPPRRAAITEANPTVTEMEARVARFAALRPTTDYVDAALPGCERRTFRVVGRAGDAPIAAEHFHLNLVHCEPGKSAPLHSHLTQELFLVLSGRWQLFWGPAGERRLELGAWDAVAVPPGVSRGFRNVGPEAAWLVGIAGGRDPGEIDWPEPVRALARAAGVELP